MSQTHFIFCLCPSGRDFLQCDPGCGWSLYQVSQDSSGCLLLLFSQTFTGESLQTSCSFPGGKRSNVNQF